MDGVDKKKVEVLYPSLTSLDLSHNEIVNLPSEICELTQLAELKISYNKIKEVNGSSDCIKAYALAKLPKMKWTKLVVVLILNA